MQGQGGLDSSNIVQGDFGEAWLEAVAASEGISHGRPATVDLEKADVQLTLLEEVGDTINPTVKVQVKTEVGLRQNHHGDLAYGLDVTTYNFLSKSNHSVRRILVVIGLSEDGERVRMTDDGTLLVGTAAWVSLEGCPPSTNESKKTVYLPVANSVDGPGLRRMLEEFGVRLSTPVPDFNAWEGRV